MTIIKEGKSAEQIYNEYQDAKCIKNGVYCMIIANTYQAINPIPPVIEYTQEELKEMERGL